MEIKEINKKIKLFCDGPSINELKDEKTDLVIDGYTFNPSLFKKHNAKDYIEYCKKILDICKDKHISLEVISDDEANMIRQAELLNELGPNVHVKIPIIFTNGESTENVILDLVNKKIKLNITAIYLDNQIKRILPIIKNTETILSIFVGRIYDIGENGSKYFSESNKLIKENSVCKSLWASTRTSYDIMRAIELKADIITMPMEQIKKISNFKKNINDRSVETVKKFYEDAVGSNYKF